MDPNFMTFSINQRTCYLCLILILISYYFVMDLILYTTLQSVDVVNEKKVGGQLWSPFRPLSVKLIMQDHTTHYIITPLSEYFNVLTKFSDLFPFITPNLITFTHLFLSFLSGKFIVSDSLKSRRMGCLLYELRTFLDAFDGTVYRARAANKLYESHHSELGFWIDSTCDTLAGFVLCFSMLFCFYWKSPPRKEMTPLPFTSDNKYGNHNGVDHEKHDTRIFKYYTKKFIFWRCFCFGVQIGIGSAFWDQTIWNLTEIYSTKFDNEQLTHLQSVDLHSTTTCLIFWGWRLLEGQALEHYFLVSIWMDKAWEFLRFVQYIGIVVIGVLIVFSFYHIAQVRNTLQMVPDSSL